MAEYIEREAFLEHMKSTDRYFTVKFDIENFPAADVAPVRHGRWIYHNDGVITCSVCDNAESNDSDFCRYCGARMEL